MTAAQRRAGDDRGSVLVLGLGLVVLAMVAVGLAVDASRLFLARRSLASLADGAALRGAHDLDLAALYASGAADVLPLSAGRVERDVAAYVTRRAAANGLAGVRVVSVLVRDGTVEVELAMTEQVPLLGTVLGRPDGESVTATASARTAVRPWRRRRLTAPSGRVQPAELFGSELEVDGLDRRTDRLGAARPRGSG